MTNQSLLASGVGADGGVIRVAWVCLRTFCCRTGALASFRHTCQVHTWVGEGDARERVRARVEVSQ